MPDSKLEFFKFANSGNVAELKTMLSAGFNVNERDEKNRTALMFAIIAGQIGAVKILVEAGATLKNESDEKFSAVTLAKSSLELDKRSSHRVSPEIRRAIIEYLVGVGG
jgi:ankyrin repeat protein